MTNRVKLRERIAVKALEISLQQYGSSDYLSMVKQSVAIADAMVAELKKPPMVDAEFPEVEESPATEKVMVPLDEVLEILSENHPASALRPTDKIYAASIFATIREILYLKLKYRKEPI